MTEYALTSKKGAIIVKTIVGITTNQRPALISSCPEATIQNVCAHETGTCFR